MVFVYITCKDKPEADKISRYLLEKRLIACTNSFPISSSYWWKGKIVSEDEYVLICKTMEEKYKLIVEEVESIHSYDVPCICLIHTETNAKYWTWVEQVIKKRF